jgi:Big-like domain-containing protein
VARVDVSVDGGNSYSPAAGTTAWSFNWWPSAPGGPRTIKSRAVDNLGNMQNPPAEIHVEVDAPPTSTITFPAKGTTITTLPPIAITGTASDSGSGSVVRVEVSVDGGFNYNAATGTNTWSFNWTPSAAGQVTIKSRAVDNTGNVQNPPAEIQVTRSPITIKVPSDRLSIQSAINDAADGDTVLVAPGTYSENIDFKGKAITVTSESGPDVTTIDAGNADSVVKFISGERRDSVLTGFTLQKGRPASTSSSEGGGILIRESSPKITNNKITNNHACIGAGIGILSGSPLIQGNTITGNINDVCNIGGEGGGIYISGRDSAEILDNEISNNASAVGGGIRISGPAPDFGGPITPIIKKNVIKGNRAPAPGQSSNGAGGGIYMTGRVSGLIAQNLITGNQANDGGGIASLFTNGNIVNNTIADNDGSTRGSGIYVHEPPGRTRLTNNIIVAKPGQSGVYCTQSGSLAARFNNIFSPLGPAYGGACPDMTGTDGNISADPQFANPTQGDYHLQVGSPSIDAGDNTALNLPDTDLDGDPRILDGDGDGTSTIDMGVDEFLLPPGFTLPTSRITFPTEGGIVLIGTTITITGAARDTGGGTIARVEVSVDGGATWSEATGTNDWSFNWTPATPGPATIKSRAVDDSENQQDPPAAVTITVASLIRVPSDRPTIQAAIDAAIDGDTVQVAPGTYTENINFGGKAITVTSENGPEVTIIDGGAADPVVIFNSGEGRDSTLNGFTLQNGRAANNQGFGRGGGVRIEGSSPRITNNVITNNFACDAGGVFINAGSPLIQMNKITSNTAGADICQGGTIGGGIYVLGPGSAEILDNVISDNVSSFGGGIGLSGARTPVVKRNIIKGNSAGGGGGIWIMANTAALIVQNLITGNQASVGGGLYWLVPGGARGPILVNNTIADNDAASGSSGIFADGFDAQSELTNNIIVAKSGQFGLYCGDSDSQSQPIIRFNNIFGSGGMAYGGTCSDRTGTDRNISADPLFANPTQGDYHLQQGSPSIDRGDNLTPNLPDKDLDGHPRILDGDGSGFATVDMGVDEFLAPQRVGVSLQDESSGNMLKLNSTNGQHLFTRYRRQEHGRQHLSLPKTSSLSLSKTSSRLEIFAVRGIISHSARSSGSSFFDGLFIRDAAAPNHPVIGIAALGNSVVQHSLRDQWIGCPPPNVCREACRKAGY